MTEENKDVNNEDIDTSSDASADKDNNSSNAADGVNNADEAITLTKKDWDNTQTQIANLNKALQLEREKTKKHGLTEIDEDKKDKPDKFTEQYTALRGKELLLERKEFEAEAKKQMVKRFAKLQADNDFGIDSKVVEAYQDLLEGRIKREGHPRTQKAVMDLLERAVKMAYPDMYVAEIKRQEEEGTYEGVGGTHGTKDDTQTVRLNSNEKKLVTAVDQFLKNR